MTETDKKPHVWSNCKVCGSHLYNMVIHKNRTSWTLPYKYCIMCDRIYRVNLKELKRMKHLI